MSLATIKQLDGRRKIADRPDWPVRRNNLTALSTLSVHSHMWVSPKFDRVGIRGIILGVHYVCKFQQIWTSSQFAESFCVSNQQPCLVWTSGQWAEKPPWYQLVNHCPLSGALTIGSSSVYIWIVPIKHQFNGLVGWAGHRLYIACYLSSGCYL